MKPLKLPSRTSPTLTSKGLIAPSWQSWIFDLDDTLLDTSGLLIPRARQRAFEFLMAQGAVPSLTHCEKEWERHRTQKSGPDLFRQLITNPVKTTLGEKEKTILAKEAYNTFRSSPLPPTLTLREGARTLLETAQKLFPLYLVTQGDLKSQMEKTRLLGLDAFFSQMYFIDPMVGETKQQAFKDILQRQHFSPERVLCIGNRLDAEIGLSKELGITTCYVRYGEHSHEVPSRSEEIPDFEIIELHELQCFLEERNPTHE